MARVRLAPFIKAMSGRMDSVVYKVTKFGTEMAVFEEPSNPNTPAQQAVRANFKKGSKQWPLLTPAQAAMWRAYAATQSLDEEVTEKRYRPTGFNAFMKLAVKWFAVNPGQAAAPATPPATTFAGDTISLTIDSESPGVIDFTASAPNAANVTTALLYQRVSNANADPIDGAYKIGKYFRFVTGTLATTLNVSPGYYAVGYQFVNTATGQVTSPVFVGIIGPVSFEMVDGGQSTKKKAA